MANVTWDPSPFCEICSTLFRLCTCCMFRSLCTERERSVSIFRLFLTQCVFALHTALHTMRCYIYIGTAHAYTRLHMLTNTSTRLSKAIKNDVLCIEFPYAWNIGFHLSNHSNSFQRQKRQFFRESFLLKSSMAIMKYQNKEFDFKNHLWETHYVLCAFISKLNHKFAFFP